MSSVNQTVTIHVPFFLSRLVNYTLMDGVDFTRPTLSFNRFAFVSLFFFSNLVLLKSWKKKRESPYSFGFVMADIEKTTSKNARPLSFILSFFSRNELPGYVGKIKIKRVASLYRSVNEAKQLVKQLVEKSIYKNKPIKKLKRQQEEERLGTKRCTQRW